MVFWLPTGLIHGAHAHVALADGQGHSLAGRNDVAFGKLTAAGGKAADQEIIAKFSRARPNLCGLSPNRTAIMAILNITPDSFSDGGKHFGQHAALNALDEMADAGVDVVDIGGESTRPGATELTWQEEWGRIEEAVKHAVGLGPKVSVDTRKAPVMEKALEAGVDIINDVSALEFDADALPLLAGQDVDLVLMHHRGTPQNMQELTNYNDLIPEIMGHLQGRVEACVAAGHDRARIMIDPGIGFAKSLEQNYDILHALPAFHGLGQPILLGVSRKSLFKTLPFAGHTEGRLPASLAAQCLAIQQAVQMLRVHDWRESLQMRAFMEHLWFASTS